MTKLAEVERAEQLPKYHIPPSVGDLRIDLRSWRYQLRYPSDSHQTISITKPDGTITDFAFSDRRLRAIAQEQPLGDHSGRRTTIDWTYSRGDHTQGRITREYFDGSNTGQLPLYEYYLVRHATHIQSYAERARAIALAEQPPVHYQVIYESGRMYAVEFFDREAKRTYHQSKDTDGNTSLVEYPVATNPAMQRHHETPVEAFYRRAHQSPSNNPYNLDREQLDKNAYRLWRERQNRKPREVIPITGNTVEVRGLRVGLQPDLAAIIRGVLNQSGLNVIFEERKRNRQQVDDYWSKRAETLRPPTIT